jgi:uncharacterized protein YfkK (UPF0435 family)
MGYLKRMTGLDVETLQSMVNDFQESMNLLNGRTLSGARRDEVDYEVMYDKFIPTLQIE